VFARFPQALLDVDMLPSSVLYIGGASAAAEASRGINELAGRHSGWSLEALRIAMDPMTRRATRNAPTGPAARTGVSVPSGD
jgi:hypothetical protein